MDTSIFKAYDIRGIWPEQIDGDVGYKIAQGYVNFVKPQGEVLVGCDVRIHSGELKEKVIEGLLDAGVDVVDVGVISTDMYYFGVGNYNLAGGLQVTASHNPPEWHGIKMVREKVAPLTGEYGITQIKDFVVANKKLKNTRGKLRRMDILDDFCRFALKRLDGVNIKRMKVVYNPNFGFAGKVFERLVSLGQLPLDIVPLNAEPDGTFPKGRPDPFLIENRGEFCDLVKQSGADFGVAWDADADRVFFCADGGLFLEPYHLNTLLIQQVLEASPGEKIIYDPRYVWALRDAIESNGGKAIEVRVGHSYIKEAMWKNNAIFATESSGHTYYRDFWFADSGVLPVMQMLKYLSSSGFKLSEVVGWVVNKYCISGEINQKVDNPAKIIEALKNKYSDGRLEWVDGLSVEYVDFRFNVRTSNTEPLLRLNLEAKSQEIMETKRDEILGIIRS